MKKEQLYILALFFISALTTSSQTISGGNEFSLFLTSDGKLYSWGNNDNGELGNGSFEQSLTPVSVDMSGVLAGKTITAIDAGYAHSLALASDGTVYAWGENRWGWLGNGNQNDSNVPVAVDMSGTLAGKTVIAIAAGREFSAALSSDGIIYTWGANYRGELGGGDEPRSNVPVVIDTSGVLSGKFITAIAAGESHALALASDGTLYAWGENDFGEYGNGSNDDSWVPVAVDMTGVLSGKTIIAIDAGKNHSLALASDGTVYAWGSNEDGLLGNNYNTSRSNVPVAVDMSDALSGKTITEISCGYQHSLALSSDGTIYSWGSDNEGQLGTGTSDPLVSPSPVAVDMSGALAGKTVSTISAARFHSLVVASDNMAYAWGQNYNGQLGTGETGISYVPEAVVNGGITNLDENLSEIPIDFSLAQNYPNPFNPSTTLTYSIPNRSDVSLKVFDMLGREVAELVNGEKPAGVYEVDFNAENLSSGVYFYTLRTNEFKKTKKMVMLR